MPFFACPYPSGTMVAPRRDCAPIGWLETNVVQRPFLGITEKAEKKMIRFLQEKFGGN